LAFQPLLRSQLAFQPRELVSSLRVAASDGDMVELVDANYRQILAGDGNWKRTVLVDVCAPWCGPCKLIEPVLKTCAEEWSNTLDVVKYNVDGENKDVKVELLMQGVMPRALPCLILFHEGKAIASRTGVVTDISLNHFLDMKLPDDVLDVRENQASAGFISLAAANTSDGYMLTER